MTKLYSALTGFIMIFMLISVGSFAQLDANAGPDVYVCSDFANGLIPKQIGGDPTVTGGTPPYTYAWETFYSLTIGSHTYHFYASDYLDDTTLANPTIIYGNSDSLVFRVTVRDFNTNTAVDSMTARFSTFYSTLEDKNRTITQGDSVQLYSSVIGGIPPLSYTWTPVYNLSDPNTANPWAKPDTTVSYINVITDHGGCQFTDMDAFEVYVIPLGVSGETGSENLILINPNPMEDHSVVRLSCPTANVELQFFNSAGQLQKVIVPRTSQFSISKNDFKEGLYFYALIQNGRQISKGKLIVK